MRALAIATAVIHILLVGFVALLMLAVAAFAEQREPPAWFAPAAPITVLLALVGAVAVLARSAVVAGGAFAAELVLVWAFLRHVVLVSGGSDGELIAIGLAAGATAAAATYATATPGSSAPADGVRRDVGGGGAGASA